MVLGFGERIQTVSEAEALLGEEFINREFLITSSRISEVQYEVGVRSVISGQPIIEPVDSPPNPQFDGLFGSREENTVNNLVYFDILHVATTRLPVLRVTIRDDLFLEDEECFVLSIFPVNPQEMINFMCHVAGDEFLCIHEICIEDDDG